MSNQFDWQTEDDDGWEKSEDVGQETAVSRELPWRTIAIILGLLVVAILMIQWQFNRRIEALTAVIEADVLSTHNLINRAVSQQDLELIAPLLSAKDLAWTKAQEQLLEQELFFDRPQLGLQLTGNHQQSQSLTAEDDRYLGIDVSPDMNEAVLSYAQEYQTDNQGGSVLLQQTAVYRRGKSRWLLSPPTEAFWGEWQTIETEDLTLVYPKRDAEIATQLAEDLPLTIGRSCQMLEEHICPDNLRLHLRLDGDPKSLLAAADPATLYDGNLRLNLPAPTLVGLPLDEGGYQALLRSYAAPVMAAIITRSINWDCCDHAPVYQALMEYQLAQLGLRPWPVNLETYTNVVNSGLNVDAIFPFWIESSFSQLKGSAGWQMMAFVDFLMRQNLTKSPLEIMASLSEAQTLQQWLADLFAVEDERGFVFQDRLSRDWWLDAQGQMLATQRAQPISFPDQELLMTCASEFGDNLKTTLYRRQMSASQWQPLREEDGFLFITPLSNDEGVVMASIDFSSEFWRTSLLENGQITPIFDEGFPMTLSWAQVDPTGEQLLLYTSQTPEGDLQPTLANLPACREGDCQFTPLPGVPVWSPDGQRAILVAMSFFLENGLVYADNGRVALFDSGLYFQNLPLFRANAAAIPEVPIPPDRESVNSGGNLPFWQDENKYGYISTLSAQEATQEVLLASVTDDIPTPILTTDDLLDAIPEEERPFRLAIRAIQPHPRDSDLLVILAASRLDSYLFMVDLKNDLIENPLQFGSGTSHFFGFSPDGRYLVVTGSPGEGFRGPQDVVAFYLYDIGRNKTQTFIVGAPSFAASYTFDWSADGKWLALSMNNGTVNLIAPDYNYQHLLSHNFVDCSSLAWVNIPDNGP